MLAVGRDPVDRGIGEAGQRHRARVDVLLAAVPFVGDRLGQRLASARPAVARAGVSQRPPVELDAPATVRLGDRFGRLPEALHL